VSCEITDEITERWIMEILAQAALAKHTCPKGIPEST
jgi:hypothetical protein